jgi:hypothetical protein
MDVSNSTGFLKPFNPGGAPLQPAAPAPAQPVSAWQTRGNAMEIDMTTSQPPQNVQMGNGGNAWSNQGQGQGQSNSFFSGMSANSFFSANTGNISGNSTFFNNQSGGSFGQQNSGSYFAGNNNGGNSFNPFRVDAAPSGGGSVNPFLDYGNGGGMGGNKPNWPSNSGGSGTSGFFGTNRSGPQMQGSAPPSNPFAGLTQSINAGPSSGMGGGGVGGGGFGMSTTHNTSSGPQQNAPRQNSGSHGGNVGNRQILKIKTSQNALVPRLNDKQ